MSKDGHGIRERKENPASRYYKNAR
jgi:hypothetical protein